MAAGYPPPSPSPPSLFSMPASSATTVKTMAAAVEAARDPASLPRRPCGEERSWRADRGAAQRRGAAAAGRPRCGAAERSGLGGPSAMTGGARGGQARRQAERAAGQAAARQAAEVRTRAAGRSAAGSTEATAARPSPAPAVSTSGARSSCSRARCASAAAAAAAAAADAMAAALRRARSSRARMRTAGRPSSGIRAWEEAGRNCRRRAPPPSPAAASSLVELRRPRSSSSKLRAGAGAKRIHRRGAEQAVGAARSSWRELGWCAGPPAVVRSRRRRAPGESWGGARNRRQ